MHAHIARSTAATFFGTKYRQTLIRHEFRDRMYEYVGRSMPGIDHRSFERLSSFEATVLASRKWGQLIEAWSSCDDAVLISIVLTFMRASSTPSDTLMLTMRSFGVRRSI